MFLIAFTLVQNSKYSVISDETVSDTVKILKSKNINISADKIDRKQVGLNVISLKNAVVSHNFPSGFTREDEKTFSAETSGSLNSEGDVKRVLSSVGINRDTEIIFNEKSAVVNLKVSGFPVFDVSLTLTEQNGKVKISGSWYSAESKPKKAVTSRILCR